MFLDLFHIMTFFFFFTKHKFLCRGIKFWLHQIQNLVKRYYQVWWKPFMVWYVIFSCWYFLFKCFLGKCCNTSGAIYFLFLQVVERKGRSSKKGEGLLVLSCEEDYGVCLPFLEKGLHNYFKILLLGKQIEELLNINWIVQCYILIQELQSIARSFYLTALLPRD